MQAQRRRFRRLLTPALAGLVGLGGIGTGIGLAASPAAAAPNLSISLAVAAQVTNPQANTLYVGQPVSYAVTVTNGTASPETTVTVSGAVPTDWVLGGSSSADSWSACTDTSGALSCSLASLAASASSTVTLSFTPAVAQGPVNLAPTASDAASDAATVTPAVVETVAPDADLSIVKAIVTPVPSLSYTLTVGNAGPSASGPVTVTDRLSPGLTAPVISTDGTHAWVCSTASLPTITCALAAGMTSGDSSTITVAATGTARVTDGASVSGGVFDPNSTNNSAAAPQGLVPYGTTADPGPCALSGVIRTCDLVAAAGTVTVPGFANPVPVWGFAIDPTPGAATAPPPGTVPGPTLVANEGETLQLVLRNALPCLKVSGGVGTVANYPCPGGVADRNVLAVQIPGMTTSRTDDTGIPSGTWTAAGDPRYTWAKLKPGTYVYEAGQTVNGGRQLAMGLEGLLVVRPTGFSPTSAALFDPPVSPVAPLQHAATNGSGPTTTTTVSTTAQPSTTTGAPTTTSPPATTTSVAGGGTASAAAVSTTIDTTTSTDPSTTTTTAAPQATTSTTAAPQATTSTTAASQSTTSTTAASQSTTTTTVGPGGNSPSKSAALLAGSGPSACSTPATGASGFTAEALVQVNEMSSQFHANPFTSVMTPGGGNDPINTLGFNGPGGSPDIATYVPDIFLLNGKAYPSTDPISVTPTDCVALHFANFGMLEKSFGVLDQRETIMADDSVALLHPQSVATRYLNPGEEVDAVIDMTGSASGQQFPVMDFEHHLHNGPGTSNNTVTPSSSTGMALGGQLTLLQVDGPDPAMPNPVVSSIGMPTSTVAVGGGVGPTPSALSLTASGVPIATGASIIAGEWTIDSVDNPAGSGLAAPGMSGALTSGVATPISMAFATPLSNGDHTIWARFEDSNHNWSAPAGVVFTYDSVNSPNTATTKCPDSPNAAGGPVVCNLSLDPNVTNGNTPNKTAGPIGRTDTATFANNSPTIKDTSITSADSGQPVTGPGIPNGATVGNVTDGKSFDITPLATLSAQAGVQITIGTPGVPAVSSDVNIDGFVMPSLSDWAITGFTWQIDHLGTPVFVQLCTPDCGPGSSTELAGTIPASSLTGLADGQHTVSIVATETLNGGSPRTSMAVTIPFTLDTTGPTTSIDTVTPSPAGPSSDNLANLNYFPSVHISGTIKPAALPGVSVAGGEMTFAPVCPPSGLYRGAACTPNHGVFPDPSLTDTIPAANGSGAELVPHGGSWTEGVGTPVAYDVELPTAEFNGFPQGVVRIYVHAKDQDGQWGSWTAYDLSLDKTPPVVVGAATVTGSAPHFTLNFTAEDPAGPAVGCNVNNQPNGCGGITEQSGVAAVEWQISYADSVDTPGVNDFTQFFPAPTSGPQLLHIDISGGPQPYPAGTNVLFRVMDGAGNWTGWSSVQVLP